MKKLLVFLATLGIMTGVLFIATKQQVDEKPNQVAPIEKKLIVEPKIATFDEAKNSITEENLSGIVRYLCDPKFAGRMSAQKGNEEAANWIAEKFKAYGLQPGVNGSYFQSFPIQNFNEAKEKGNGKTANVIGVLPGGPRTFIVGAHFDHIGWGPKASQSPNRREIHPGADDNASGTSSVMELARAFGMLKGQNKHTIIFIAFSGEEMGLIGANYYVNSVPLNQLDFMINYDMVGRFKESVMFYGAGSTPQFKKAAAEVVKSGAKINVTDNSGGGSDHASFARKGIPVTFFHTGQHAEYHTPDDTPSRINFKGLKDVTQWTFHYCWLLDKEESFPRVNLFVPQGEWKDHNMD